MFFLLFWCVCVYIYPFAPRGGLQVSLHWGGWEERVRLWQSISLSRKGRSGGGVGGGCHGAELRQWRVPGGLLGVRFLGPVVTAFQPLLDLHIWSGHTQVCKITFLPAVRSLCVALGLPSPWKYLKREGWICCRWKKGPGQGFLDGRVGNYFGGGAKSLISSE